MLAVIAALIYLKFALPNVGKAPELKVEMTAERIARGKYLANNVAVCMDCHSKRDWSRFAGPPVPATLGMGGEIFDQKFGYPGSYSSKNITPAGISRYSDGELFRVISSGVNREGKALFPIMPYLNYGLMDEEDIRSIIAYIRTLIPVRNQVPESASDFPMNFIINLIPKKAGFSKLPPASEKVNLGRYLVNAANCKDCHTQFAKGTPVKGVEFGGGREFSFPDGSMVRSANITPDLQTGIGNWDEETFVDTFRSHSDSLTLSTKLVPGEFNSIMPWTLFGQMHEEDLKAIFAYLKTLKPIKNRVVRFTPGMKPTAQ